MSAKTVVAKSMFPAEVKGATVVVIGGARFSATDPVVKAHPGMFEPVKTKTTKPRTRSR
jgi:hypothetical protein